VITSITLLFRDLIYFYSRVDHIRTHFMVFPIELFSLPNSTLMHVSYQDC